MKERETLSGYFCFYFLLFLRDNFIFVSFSESFHAGSKLHPYPEHVTDLIKSMSTAFTAS